MKLGLMPTRPNGTVDRRALAREYGWSVDEIYRAKDSWRAMHKRQPASTLTFRQYLDMMRASGLRPRRVGLRAGQYHLARPGDRGAYDLGNCRFVPQEVNQGERNEGYQRRPEVRERARLSALGREKKSCPHCGARCSPGMFARWHGGACRAGARPGAGR